MNALDRCVEFIAAHEGCRLKAYPDPASPLAIALRKRQNVAGLSGAPWTIGYGETLGISEGMTWTKEQARTQLKRRVAGFMAAVKKLITNANENQLIACVSLAYNIGLAAFKASSVCRFTARGDYARAAESFKLWNKAQGQILKGLTLRRLSESILYLTPI